MNYHFRSLDTWLDGVCKSCCEEHPWHSDVLNYLETAGKRSIFCQETQGDDCSAGGDEEDDEGEKKVAAGEAGEVANTADEREETVEEATVPVLASSSAEDEGEQRHAPGVTGTDATDVQQHNELASNAVAKGKWFNQPKFHLIPNELD